MINDARVFDVFKRLLLTQDPRLPLGASIGHASCTRTVISYQMAKTLKVYSPRMIWLTFKPEFPSLTETRHINAMIETTERVHSPYLTGLAFDMITYGAS